MNSLKTENLIGFAINPATGQLKCNWMWESVSRHAC